MGALMRWEPFEDLVPFRTAVSRFFRGEPIPDLAVDVYETDKDVVVKASLPGVKPEDIKISVAGDVLNIKAEVKSEEKVEKKNYVYQERRYGKVSREIRLPAEVLTDQSKAEFEHGVLTLTMPKTEKGERRTIKVKAK